MIACVYCGGTGTRHITGVNSHVCQECKGTGFADAPIFTEANVTNANACKTCGGIGTVWHPYKHICLDCYGTGIAAERQQTEFNLERSVQRYVGIE